MQCVQDVSAQAPDYADVLSGLLSMLHALALLQQVTDAYDISMGNEESLRALAKSLSPEDIQLYYQIGLVGRRDLPLAPEPRCGLEMVLLRMLAFRPDGDTPVKTKSVTKAVISTPEKTNSAKSLSEPASSVTVDSAVNTSVDNKHCEAIKEPTPVIPSISHPEKNNDWHHIVEGLNVGGMLQQLAAQSVMTQHESNNIDLCIAPANAAMLTPERQMQMQEALSSYFGHSIKLKIEVQDHNGETPALRDERTQQTRQDDAEAAIDNDENVRSLIDAFDGKVRPNSVRPVD